WRDQAGTARQAGGSAWQAAFMASARPLIRTRQRVSIPLAANRMSVSGSECLLSAGPWHQYQTVSRLDFLPAAMSPQRESLHRLITTDEKCLPPLHHRSEALHARLG